MNKRSFMLRATHAILGSSILQAADNDASKPPSQPNVLKLLLGLPLNDPQCAAAITAWKFELFGYTRRESRYKGGWNAWETHVYSRIDHPVRLIFEGGHNPHPDGRTRRVTPDQLRLRSIEVEFPDPMVTGGPKITPEIIFGVPLPDCVRPNSKCEEIRKVYASLIEDDTVLRGKGIFSTKIAAHHGETFFFAGGILIKYRVED